MLHISKNCRTFVVLKEIRNRLNPETKAREKKKNLKTYETRNFI